MTTGDQDSPVVVGRGRDLFEAQLMSGFLESRGIPAYIPNESSSVMLDGVVAIWSKGVAVEVPADRADEAKQLLAEFRESYRPEDSEEE